MDSKRDILDHAQDAFWASVAKAHPHVKAGDFPPHAQAAFDEACKKALDMWLWCNRPQDPLDVLRSLWVVLIQERQRALSHQQSYLTGKITLLRELKMRQQLGEKAFKRSGDSYEKPIAEVIESERNSLRYALTCVRRARRELYKVYALRKKLPRRV